MLLTCETSHDKLDLSRVVKFQVKEGQQATQMKQSDKSKTFMGLLLDMNCKD